MTGVAGAYRDWQTVALAVACAIAIVQTARIYLARAFARRRLRVRMDHAADGEARAEALLVARGYAILGRQASTSYDVVVDGEPVAIALRADYLVEAFGRSYVAEVKTGARAPRVETPGTRRQMLEYLVAFDVDGVLLVDVDAERIHAVTFPLGAASREELREAPSRSPLAFVLCGLALGALATAATLAYLRGAS